MDVTVAWLIVGLMLVILELVSGTFYLLVLGIASLLAAAIGYVGMSFTWQAIGASVASVVGVVWVRRHRQRVKAAPMPSLDVGAPTTFDAWIDRDAGHARVKYRDALWDARISGAASGNSGETLYITAVDGNTLTVSKARPA
jgi:membrane protein implicated in regulation of membrane protease activity